MKIDFESDKAIFLQVAEAIEDAILSGAYPEESQIPSITEFSRVYKINPATALKGINLLVGNGIIYKKRGLGMFVQTGAEEKLRENRRDDFYENYIKELISEAKKLKLEINEVQTMIERGFSR